ncbi:ADP-ribosylglycohydrolase family protein [Fundidesulfovibrio butyratiphilus]
MYERAKSMVLASFVGDSLALGVHWIYDQPRILALHPHLDGLTDPDPAGYHPNRKRGDFTHYGDQTFVLLASLARCGGFDAADFASSWRNLFSQYDGYLDRATRSTLERLDQGWTPEDAGSNSTDLAGAARIAPLVFALRRDEETLVAAARAQTALTHRHQPVIDAAECFARAALLALSGQDPVNALRLALQGRLPGSPLHAWLAEGLEAADEDTSAAVARLGQSCHVDGAFAAVVQIVARHPFDLPGALLASTLAGGDSAARNMLIGLLLGAAPGGQSLPEDWLAGLNARAPIEGLLDEIERKMTT